MQVDDQLLIRQCLKGRKEYFEPLVTRYEQPLYRYCFHLCANDSDAMDLFQETWLKAVSKIHRYDNGHSFKTWLFSIATNEFKDRYRKAARRRPRSRTFGSEEEKASVMNRVESAETGPDAALEEKELRSYVKAEVARLKWDYRSVIVLHYFEGLAIEEIGGVLGIPSGTVKSRLYHARKALKSVMEGKL